MQPGRFLVQREAGSDADDRCVPIVFDTRGITPRRWTPATEGGYATLAARGETHDDLSPARGLALAIIVSLPLWTLVVVAVRRLLGAG